MNAYEAKKQARIDRYNKRAERAAKNSDASYSAASAVAGMIPIGQPILVGHHSERRHRRDIDKMDNRMRKSIEEQKKADYWSDRAIAAEENTAISSDDPEALPKLERRLAELQAEQERDKKINALARKKDIAGLQELGLSEKKISELLTPYLGSIGIPPFTLSNRNANIRRIKDRIESLKKHAAIKPEEAQFGKVKVVLNTEENRVQLFFPGKPSAEYRKELKRHGFHWSAYNGAWQRQLNGNAIYWAKSLAKSYTE